MPLLCQGKPGCQFVEVCGKRAERRFDSVGAVGVRKNAGITLRGSGREASATWPGLPGQICCG